MEPTQPNICLFCYRCVEEPVPPIFAEKFWKVGWVTVALTESVRLSQGGSSIEKKCAGSIFLLSLIWLD